MPDQTTSPCIACIVEGHGEVVAVPELIRRIGFALEPPVSPRLPRPIRVSKSSLVHTAGEFERMVGLATRAAGNGGSILVLLDADEDCPVELAQDLRLRAHAAVPHVPIAVVVAKRELEAWFLAALSSLSGKAGLQAELPEVERPEAIGDAKGRLGKYMETGRYRSSVDQVRLASSFDLEEAQTARSFQKFHKDVVGLLTLGLAGRTGHT